MDHSNVIKVNFKQMDEVEILPDRLWVSQSESRPGIQHITMWYKDGDKFVCTCDGWQGHNRCWHVDRVMEMTR